MLPAGSLAFKALDTLTRAPSADGASQAWVAATSAGSLHAVRSIDGHTWHLLQSVQKAMASHPGFDSSLHSLLDHAGAVLKVLRCVCTRVVHKSLYKVMTQSAQCGSASAN